MFAIPIDFKINIIIDCYWLLYNKDFQSFGFYQAYVKYSSKN